MLSEKCFPNHNHHSTAFHLHPLLFSKSPLPAVSLLMQMLTGSFSFLYGCTWSPLSSAGIRCTIRVPGAQWEHQSGLLKGSSPRLPSACALAAVRVIFHLCLIFLWQNVQGNGAWTCFRYLKILCRKENCFPFNSTQYFFFLFCLKAFPSREGKEHF